MYQIANLVATLRKTMRTNWKNWRKLIHLSPFLSPVCKQSRGATIKTEQPVSEECNHQKHNNHVM